MLSWLFSVLFCICNRKHASVPDLLSKVLEEERAKRDKMSDRIYAFGTMLRRNISLKSVGSFTFRVHFQFF